MFMLDTSLAGILAGFNCWNWYLACSGMTSVEFLKRMHYFNDDIYDFSYNTVKDNLFIIFGTH